MGESRYARGEERNDRKASPTFRENRRNEGARERERREGKRRQETKTRMNHRGHGLTYLKEWEFAVGEATERLESVLKVAQMLWMNDPHTASSAKLGSLVYSAAHPPPPLQLFLHSLRLHLSLPTTMRTWTVHGDIQHEFNKRCTSTVPRSPDRGQGPGARAGAR